MSFKNTVSTNQLKVLGVLTILICISFYNLIPDAIEYRVLPKDDLDFSIPSLDLLPLEEAKSYCAATKWKPYPHRDVRRKVYDLILINTELEWLEIRLGQMVDHVDYFVILESPTTFQFEPKPLFVRENWARFKPYHHKMILRTMDTSSLNLKGNKTEHEKDQWTIEHESRNAMYDQIVPFLTGEQEAFPGDVLLVSDVDEIPRPSAIKTLRNCDFPPILALHTKMYYYGFQWAKKGDWPHPQATYYNGSDTLLPSGLRHGPLGADLYNAGWHCSFCFPTVEEMITKVKSFSHQELNQEIFTDPDKIVARVREGKDMFDREEERCVRVEDMDDVPGFLRENQERYAYLLNRDEPNAGFEDYTPPE